MADPILFEIPVDEVGAFGLALVNKGAPGYLDSWQAPGGKTLTNVTLADFHADSGSWVCQVTSSALVSSPNVATTERAATFCAPAAQVSTVSEDSFSIELGYFQDPNSADGLSAFLFENRTKEAYVYFGADGDNPPRAIGRVRLVSGNIGGAAKVKLDATATFPLERAPDIQFGTSGDSRIVTGAGTAAFNPTGVTPGTPGVFTPEGFTWPPNLTALRALGPLGETTAWTAGQYVVLGDLTLAHWDGDSWEAGVKP